MIVAPGEGLMTRRLAATLSLAAVAVAFALAVLLAVRDFPRGLPVVACTALAGLVAWRASAGPGPPRARGVALAAGVRVFPARPLLAEHPPPQGAGGLPPPGRGRGGPPPAVSPA